MSEVKHTPGPWEARTFLVVGGERMSDRICHVGTSTSLGPPRSHETEANARLIAAAPDLLAALILARQTLAFFTSVIKSGEPWTDTCQRERDAAVQKADVAIAKAEGR